MKVPFIFLDREAVQDKKFYMDGLAKVIESGMYICGENVQNLEKQLAGYLGVKYVVTMNSGTDALFLSLKAMGIGQEDEVITVSNSFVATIGAIVAVGAKPVLVDVEDDFLIDPDKLKEKFTDKTRAVIPVHLTGRPAAMNKINQIAGEYGVTVIDDGAQSFGSKYYGDRFFNCDVSCYSFHPLKIFHSLGDGGAVATNNESVYEELIKLRNHGLVGKSSDLFGYNSRLDEMQAVILSNTLHLLDAKLEKRRIFARKYINSLKDMVLVPDWDKNVMKPAFQTFVIKTDKRDELALALNKKGIETKIHYSVPCHKQKAFDCRGDYKLPNTEKQAKQILSLPISHLLTNEEQDYIINSIKDFF